MLLIVLALVGQTGPGPLDALRANYAASHVDLKVEYRIGTVNKGRIIDGALWSATSDNLGFHEVHERTAVGRWECDGTTEHIVCGPPEDTVPVGATPKAVGPISVTVESYETLFDGATEAHHLMDKDNNAIQIRHTERPLYYSHTPFLWIASSPLPAYLKKEFSGVRPVRSMSTRGGHPVEVEVYRRDLPSGWYQVEVSYDPAIGYLPRYERAVQFNPDRGNANVKEQYLTGARACAAGGFVPTEWYGTFYSIENFEANYPNYDDDTILNPTVTNVPLSHFRATGFRDRTSPVRMDRLDGVRAVIGPGGVVPLSTSHESLTLDRLKQIIGRKISAPTKPSLPNIDWAERNEFAGPPRRTWTRIVSIGLAAAAVLVASVVAIRRARFLLILLGLSMMTGCGLGERPIPRLSADLRPARFLYDSTNPHMGTTLIVRNTGNCRLLISGWCPRSIEPWFENAEYDMLILIVQCFL